MIGLDTNVLVRFLTQDDPIQAQKVNRLFEEAETTGRNLWISLITLCELAWVLESCYDISKNELTEILTKLFRIKQIRIENTIAAEAALTAYKATSRVDFSDCLIGFHNASHHCIHTVTFDKQALRLKEFTPL